jgi:predicted nucleic acid-binding protein
MGGRATDVSSVPAVQWLNNLNDTPIVISGFAVMELIQGCRSQADQRRVMKLIESYEVHWLDAEGCDQAPALFAAYRLSHNLGMIDALIAQTAIGLEVPLATFNQKHYTAVPRLKTVQPYRRT